MKLSSTIYTCTTTKNACTPNEIRNLNDETANWRKNDEKNIVSGEAKWDVSHTKQCVLCVPYTLFVNMFYTNGNC